MVHEKMIVKGKENMNNTKISWSRLLRSVLALTLVMAMLLCGCGANNDEDTKPETNNNGGLTLGDGDGKFEAQDVVDGTTTIYGALLKAIGGGMGDLSLDQGMQMETTVTLGDDLLNMLSSMMSSYGMGSDVSFLKSFGFSTTMLSQNSLMQEEISVKLGSTTLATAKMIMDMAKSNAYVCLPELNSNWLGFVMNTGDSSASGMMIPAASVLGSLEAYADIVDALPTEQALNTLMSRYLDIIVKALPAATTSTKTLSVGSVSQEVTATTHTFTTHGLMAATKAVLVAAKTDKDLEKVLDDISKYGNDKAGTNEDLHADMLEGINYALDSYDEAIADVADETLLTLVIYTAGDQQVGLQINVPSANMNAYAYSLKNGDNTAFELNVMNMVKFSGTGTLKSGKANGNYTLTVQGQNMLSVEVKNFNKSALEQGNLEGTLRIKPSAFVLSNIPANDFLTTNTVIEIVMKVTGDNSNISFNLYNGDKLMVGLSMLTKMIANGSVKAPTNYIDPTKDPDAFEGWVEGMNFDKLLSNLRKAGVPDSLVEMIEQGIEEGFVQASPNYPEYDVPTYPDEYWD